MESQFKVIYHAQIRSFLRRRNVDPLKVLFREAIEFCAIEKKKKKTGNHHQKKLTSLPLLHGPAFQARRAIIHLGELEVLDAPAGADADEAAAAVAVDVHAAHAAALRVDAADAVVPLAVEVVAQGVAERLLEARAGAVGAVAEADRVVGPAAVGVAVAPPRPAAAGEGGVCVQGSDRGFEGDGGGGGGGEVGVVRGGGEGEGEGGEEEGGGGGCEVHFFNGALVAWLVDWFCWRFGIRVGLLGGSIPRSV